MTDEISIESQPGVQKWGVWIVGGVFIGAFLVYAIRFPIPFNGNQEVWGQFGDFIGGLVNPIIGFFTILLLSVSLRQNQKALAQANAALSQANIALGQSKEELELTRISIQDAANIQKLTEKALQDQIAIASHTRDLNNAITLWTAVQQQVSGMREEVRLSMSEGGFRTSPDFEKRQRSARFQLEQLDAIKNEEIKRLVDIYGDPCDPSA